MKKILILIILFSFTDIYSQESEQLHPYFLSTDAEYSIFKFIQNENKDEIEFRINEITENRIIFEVFTNRKQINNSNRKLFIDDRFYPINFMTDNFFRVIMEKDFPVIHKVDENGENQIRMKMPSVTERIKNKELYRDNTKPIIYCGKSIYWIVDKDGNLLETNSK